ncbi:MAG: prepilin-type N-terminal cleavage/methylation domain-containing protein [Sedimentisphaerales bacterium]|nr:prepilin-type N-terminal cleavage/methylation domain-containing protein [Sedimentisphaerales bacterium]
MKSGSSNNGFTLIEMVLVIAIIIILVSMIVGVAKRMDDQAKERLCKNTLTLVGNALEQFRDFGYEYKDANYAGLVFPLDCNNFSPVDLQNTIRNAIYPPAPPSILVIIAGGAHDPNFSGSAAMYFILSQVPVCRTTLDKIDKSLLTAIGTDGINPIKIEIAVSGVIASEYPFTRIIDPWGTTLRYDYYPDFADYAGTWQNYIIYRNSAKLTFPVITSAGPDKKFGTKDDISNIQQK